MSSPSYNLQCLIIDNYDSYTYNLYQIIYKLTNIKPIVIYNNNLLPDLLLSNIDFILISPGPGRPENIADFGICKDILLQNVIPVLGICLGIQGLSYVNGGKIIHANEPMHGLISEIYYNNDCVLFNNIPQGFKAVRYNSLIVDPESLPSNLIITARSKENEIMALQRVIKDYEAPMHAVQFHPESACTEYGERLIINFLKCCSIRRTDLVPNATIENNDFTTPKLMLPSILPSKSIQLKSMVLEIDWVDSELLFCNLYNKSKNCFWLDSSRVEKGVSRFSYMGQLENSNLSTRIQYDVENKEVRLNDKRILLPNSTNFLSFLKNYMDQYCLDDNYNYLNDIVEPLNCDFDFMGGVVGYFGYELKDDITPTHPHQFENASKSNKPNPESLFIFADRFIAFDHELRKTYLVALSSLEDFDITRNWLISMRDKCLMRNLIYLPLCEKDPSIDNKKLEFKMRTNQLDYIDDIAKCLVYINDGESYELCLTNHFSTDYTLPSLDLYRTLRKANPVPYASYFDLDYYSGEKVEHLSIVSSSPERFLKINKTGIIESKPIKGTLPRGATKEEDHILREKLKHSKKDFAENLMIVDLIRNDLGRVCEAGSVHVTKMMVVESYATVHQLVSSIEGKLLPEISISDIFNASFPPGSMTGAPKIRSVDLLNQLEVEPRGIYSGSIGYWSLNKSSDFNVVIRTAVIKNNKLTIGAGGAIVHLSDPKEEFEEVLLKTKSVIGAILKTQYSIVDTKELFNHVTFKGSDTIFTPPSTVISSPMASPTNS